MTRRSKQNLPTREECVDILKRNSPQLQKLYGVTSLAIFGSVARNQYHKYSDVDVLVTFSETPSLFALIKVEHYLSDCLYRRVDLIMENNIKPSFKQRISQDIIRIW